MKLAQALQERSDLQNLLAQLQSRLNNNAKVQEGDEPEEDPKELLAQMASAYEKLEALICAINKTNCLTDVGGGHTLSDLLAKRDVLKNRISAMRAFIGIASQKVDRFSHTEIRIKSTVPVSELQKQVDLLSKELRETDGKIQELNWTTELL